MDHMNRRPCRRGPFSRELLENNPSEEAARSCAGLSPRPVSSYLRANSSNSSLVWAGGRQGKI